MMRKKSQPIRHLAPDFPKIRTVSVDRADDNVIYLVRYLIRFRSGSAVSAASFDEALEKVRRAIAADIPICGIWMIEEKRFPLNLEFEE